MSHQPEDFFAKYSEIYNTLDVKLIGSVHTVPTVIMTDTHRSVHTDWESIYENINVIVTKLKAVDAARNDIKLLQTIRLSDSIIFCRVNWRFFNTQEKVIFECTCSYTLQEREDDELKIMVAVIDEGKQQLYIAMGD